MSPNDPGYLDRSDLDGFLYLGDSLSDSDIYYVSGFLAPDRFAVLVQEKTTMLVSSMEKGRAQKESAADSVLATSDYDIMKRLKRWGKPELAYIEVMEEFLKEHKVSCLGVPFRFPAGIFQPLSQSFEVKILEGPARKARRVKSQQEIESITIAQRACERAMQRAVDLIASCKARGGVLFRDGLPLTSEQVQRAIDLSLFGDGCEAAETIVAGGRQAADPHARGTGPLPADAPIVIDIFPRSKSLRYYADMTRTVVKGEASPETRDLFDAVLLAQKAGIDAIRAGVSGEEVHAKVRDVFRDLGYPETEGCGFTHSTGHGVGLDVHELPSLGEAGEKLVASEVITVEPGLYYPEMGGVRMEDLLVVRDNGCQNLTRFKKDLYI